MARACSTFFTVLRRKFATRYREDPIRAVVGGATGAVVGTIGGIILAAANPNLVGVFGAIGGVIGGAMGGVALVSSQNDCRGANGGAFGGLVGVFVGAFVGGTVDAILGAF